LPPLKRIGELPGTAWLMISFALGLAFSLSYLRFRSNRVSLLFLSPAILLFPALFLFQSPIYKLVFSRSGPARVYPKIHATAPIVMVVFDEFPVASLMDEHQEIESKLYPSFANLSKLATWYRNATSVGEGTLNAVPAILDGLYPRTSLQLLPNAIDHPHTLFTLLGGTYQFHVIENNTRLCPEQLCGQQTKRLSLRQRTRALWSDVGVLFAYLILPADLTVGFPDISQSWKDFRKKPAPSSKAVDRLMEYDQLADWEDRPGRFKAFIDSIRPASKPALHFLHILLPHVPWEYLPSGRKHSADATILRGAVGTNDRGEDPLKWAGDSWAVTQAYQTHLLQVRLVDRLLGELIDHLKKVGLYDPSVLVITADHGVSFRLHESRRRLSLVNYPDIMAIPLFIKQPYQKEGRVDDRKVETVDILPTVADILGVALPWKMDGQSLINPSLPEKRERIFLTDRSKLVFGSSMEARLMEGRSHALQQKVQIFGSSSDLEDLYRIGAHTELIGGPLSQSGLDRNNSAVRREIEGSYDSLDFNASLIPAQIRGRVVRTRQDLFEPLHLAIAVNGTIRAVTETYLSGGDEKFSALLPDSAFQPGANEVNALVITQSKEQTAHLEIPRPGDRKENVVNFAKGGNAKQYQAEGWGNSERHFTWTNGKRARMILPISHPASAAYLWIRFVAYVAPEQANRQKVHVLANNRLIEEWIITKPEFHERILFIPEEVLGSSKRLDITLELPEAVSPASIRAGADRRELGIAVAWLKLIPQSNGVAKTESRSLATVAD
jgi:Sulfatase